MTSIVINDCFDDLNTENIRLENQLKDEVIIKMEATPEDNNHGQFEQNTKEFPFERNNKTKLIYDKQVFKCLINNCDKHFESLSLLSTHQKDSHKSNRLIKKENYARCFKCDYPSCGQLFRWGPKSIREHLLSYHLGEPQIICDFAECDKRFVSKNSLRIHKQYFHSTDRTFVCDVKECHKIFKTKTSLEEHKRIHKNVTQISCSVKRSSSLSKKNNVQGYLYNDQLIDIISKQNDNNIQEHSSNNQLTNSIPNKNHSNQVLNRIKDTPEDDDHGQSEQHIKALPFELEYKSKLIYDKLVFKCLINNCDKHFESLSLLSTHQKDSHQRNRLIKYESYERCFKCVFPGCGQLFRWGPKRARDHILSSHSVEPQFKCDFPECDKRFRTKEGFRLHKFKHKDIPFLKCDFLNCDFVSKHKRFIESHKRHFHSNFRPFVCDDNECGKRFKKKSVLEQHKRIHKNITQISSPIESSSSIAKDDNMQGHSFNDRTTNSVTIENHSKIEDAPEDDLGESDENIKTLPYEPEYKSQLIYDKLVFKCLINNCDKHFESLTLLSTHQKDSHKSYCLIKHENYERCFKCVFRGCGQLFRWGPNRVRDHIMATHSAEPQFKCDLPECDKRFYTKNNLQTHKRYTHSTVRPFVCDFKDCVKGFKIKKDLEEHKRIHKDVTRVACPVEGCASLIKEYNLQNHINKHSTVADLCCDWEGCTFKTKIKSNLEIHRNSVHLCLRNYLCDWPECGKRYKTSSSLTKHKTDRHTEGPQLVCEWSDCKVKCTSKHAMKTHVRTHTKEKPFACEWPGCEYRCALAGNLKFHSAVHSSERNYLCDYPECGKGFKTSFSLFIHKKSHSNDKYLCDWPGCEYQTVFASNLTQHRAIHSNQRNYLCDFPECDKRYNTMSSLYKHKKIHSNSESVEHIKRFVCDWPGCEYRSSLKTVLVTHFRTHTNERPFACEWPGCEYRCAHKSNLKTHFKVHQKN